MTREFLMPESTCPHCGHAMDRCSDMFGLNSPNSGDLSICIQCAGLLQFDANLKLKKLSKRELSQVATQDPKAYVQLMASRQAVRAVNQERGDRK